MAGHWAPFLFELCLKLGYPHPRYLLEHVNSRDLSDWLAFATIRPFGEYVDDMRYGRMASLLYNPHRAKGVGAKSATDMMLSRQPVKPAQDEDQMMAAMMRATKIMGQVYGDNK